jgi:hypothetical protein
MSQDAQAFFRRRQRRRDTTNVEENKVGRCLFELRKRSHVAVVDNVREPLFSEMLDEGSNRARLIVYKNDFPTP